MPYSAAYPTFRMLVTNGYIGISRGPSSPQYCLDIGSTIRVNTTTYTSDKNLKKDIRILPSERIMSLNSLNPVVYKFDESIISSGLSSTDPAYDRDHFGLVAQEVQKVYPELVYEDSLGILSVDYIGLIPILIESIKNLNEEVNKIKNNSVVKEKSSFDTDIDAFNEAYLSKNVPNPFNQNTIIEYYLPVTVKDASFYLYDLQGKQIKSLTISEKGKGKIVINGYDLQPGLYYYSLIADGRIIGTEKMVLTD